MANENANNPYSYVGTYYANGLDAIIAAQMAPTVPSFPDFIDDVFDYIKSALFDMGDEPGKLEAQQIKIAINGTISGYINANRTINDLQLSDAQMQYASELVNGVFNVKNPEDIWQHISDVQEKILGSKLTAEQQMPLLYATAVGFAAYDYWKVKGFDEMGSWWSYIDSFTPPIVKFPTWVSASMEATLISISTLRTGDDNSFAAAIIDSVSKFQGINIVYIVGGTLGVAAGKVFYKWPQKTV